MSSIFSREIKQTKFWKVNKLPDFSEGIIIRVLASLLRQSSEMVKPLRKDMSLAEGSE